MNDASITECSVVRRSVHKLDYGHKQVTATPSVAGVSEAEDCGGDVVAGRVGIAGGAALRRERQSGFRLAAALSGRGSGTGRASLAAGDGDTGSAGRDDRREQADRDRGDCREIGGHAAMAAGGCGSWAAWKRCPKLAPNVPL